MIGREQTEEEKAEIDAAKNAGKKPPAPAKGQAPPTIDPAVLEQLRLDIAAKNVRNEQLIAEWESLTVNQKFFRQCEDPFKEPAVRFLQAVNSSADNVEPPNH